MGKTFMDNPTYSKCYKKNKNFLKNTKFKIKVWNETELDTLIQQYYPEYLQFYQAFPNPFYKIDFMRPLILHAMGGIYMDMDNILIKVPQLDREYLLSNWEKEIANDLIYFQNPQIYIDYVEFMIQRIQQCKMPSTWKVRRFQYSVGQKCFHQFCKSRGFINTDKIYESYYTGTWLKAFDKKRVR